MFGIVLLLFGVFCCATSALMIKASHLHPAVLSSYRLLLAAALLSPVYVSQYRKFHSAYTARHLRSSVLPALVLALHFISWSQGARMAHTANASLIVNMVPVVMPFCMYFLMREVITKQEVVGTLVSLCGIAFLALADFGFNRANLQGDLICFGSMILFCYYLALGRLNRDFPSIWLYLVPLYAMAGAFCFIAALFMAKPLDVYPAREYMLAIGSAVVPTILGHSILNYSMKHLRGQIVSVMNLFQFLFAGIMAYFLFHEKPQPVFYAAGTFVVGGALIVIQATARERKEAALTESELEASVTPSV